MVGEARVDEQEGENKAAVNRWQSPICRRFQVWKRINSGVVALLKAIDIENLQRWKLCYVKQA